MAKIKILGKSYPYKFGMRFQRLFMDKLGINKIVDYQKKLSLLETLDTLEAQDVLAVFVSSAINAALPAEKRVDFDNDDLLDDLIYGGKAKEILEVMVKDFVDAQPKDLGKSKK